MQNPNFVAYRTVFIGLTLSLYYQIGCFHGCGRCSLQGLHLYPQPGDVALAGCNATKRKPRAVRRTCFGCLTSPGRGCSRWGSL